jgi:hypothetical protein
MGKIVRFFRVVGKLILTRGVPALTLAILFGVVAVQLDRWRVEHAPASDFINYTAFDVQNARAGEDVYFKVCRDHQENYTYGGALTVYVYRDVDPKNTPTKVYAKDIGGSIRTDCENKVLRASDFRHTPGTYKMAFCIDFRVNYNIQKTACKDSNIYKIYPQPTDIKDQLKYYQDQIDMLNRQLKDNSVNSPNSLEDQQTVTPSNIGVPGSQSPATPSGNSVAGNGSSTSGSTGNNGGSSGSADEEPSCAVNLGVGIFCGGDGLLRL